MSTASGRYQFGYPSLSSVFRPPCRWSRRHGAGRDPASTGTSGVRPGARTARRIGPCSVGSTGSRWADAGRAIDQLVLHRTCTGLPTRLPKSTQGSGTCRGPPYSRIPTRSSPAGRGQHLLPELTDTDGVVVDAVRRAAGGLWHDRRMTSGTRYFLSFRDRERLAPTVTTAVSGRTRHRREQSERASGDGGLDDSTPRDHAWFSVRSAGTEGSPRRTRRLNKPRRRTAHLLQTGQSVPSKGDTVRICPPLEARLGRRPVALTVGEAPVQGAGPPVRAVG